MTSLNDASRRAIRLSSILGAIIAFLPALFYGITHASFLGDGIKMQLMQAAFAACVAVGAPIFCMRLKSIRTWIPFIAFALFLVHATITHRIHPAMNEYGENKYKYLLVVIFLGFIYIPYLVAFNERRAKTFLWFSFVFAIGFCFINLVSSSGVDNARKSSIGLNPGVMSRMCLTAGGLAWIYLIVSGRKWYLAILALGFVAAAKTGTRGPLIAFALASTYVSFFVLSRRKFSQLVIAEIALMGLAFAFILMMPAEISDRFTLQAIGFEGSAKEGGRADLFSVAFGVLESHWWGVGFGNYATYHRFITVPHNLFLEFAVEMSILWAILAGGYIAAAIYKLTLLVSKHGKLVDAAFLFLLTFQSVNALNGGEATIQSLILYSSAGYAFVRAANMKETPDRSASEPKLQPV